MFVEVEELDFNHLGFLRSQRDRVNDNCAASCVDWYGNSRPIFYRGRVFALMGYELVEGVVRNDEIIEVGRAHLFNDLPRG